eukprot:SAG22_NODE_161_length_16908_cov_39.687965_6_plen_88_part_00
MGEDTLLYGVAMCGPLAALQTFKYKVKLVPGTKQGGMKKGKAIRYAVDLMARPAADHTDREIGTIRSLPEPELTRTMMSNAKVSKFE